MKFVEQQFLLADKDRDGSLNLEELQAFLHGINHPRARRDAGLG